MGALNAEVQKQFDLQSQLVDSCDQYYFKGFNKSALAEFDSATAMPKALPSPISALFDSVHGDFFRGDNGVDKAVRIGVKAYADRNGGEMPHASVIASALLAGSQVASGKLPTSMFDSAVVDQIKQQVAGFDSMEGGHYEQASLVPALTVVTIASVIANSLPIVAMLPNPTGSVRVPLVSLRYTTDTKFGAMNAGEYVDGENASKPYAEGRFRFAMPNTTGATYAVTARTAYADFALKTPDTNAQALPILAGNVSIKVNGIEVAHTRGNPENSRLTGTIGVNIKQDGVDIAGTNYKVSSGTVNIDTSTVTVEFNTALPSDAKIEAHLVVDFDAKDANKDFKVDPVGLSLEPEWETVQSVPMASRINVTYNLQNQLANELGLGFVGVALTIMQGKTFLEQNIRLLGELYDRAKYQGRSKTFDVSRGVTGNLSSAYNTTGDLIGELFKFIAMAKVKIRQASGGATVGYDLYVGDQGAVFLSQLPSDKFKSTGATATYGEIVRIGTLSDGTHVYHTPTAQGVVTEGVGVADMLLLGRGDTPARNPLVGTITMPPTIREAKPDTREVQFGFHSNMAGEVNPLNRYADQCFVIQMINLASL